MKQIIQKDSSSISITPPDDVLSPLHLWRAEVLKKGQACS